MFILKQGIVASTDEVTSDPMETPAKSCSNPKRKMSFSPRGESQAAALALAGAAVSHAAAAFLPNSCQNSAELFVKSPNSHDSPGS